MLMWVGRDQINVHDNEWACPASEGTTRQASIGLGCKARLSKDTTMLDVYHDKLPPNDTAIGVKTKVQSIDICDNDRLNFGS